MLKRNNFILLVLTEISFIFFLIIVIPSLFLFEKNGISQTRFENILPLDTNHSYLQSFISSRDNLNSVSVLLKNPALKSTDSVIVQLEDSHQETIKSLTINGQSIEDPGWIRLKFIPINSQKGDIFYLKITSNAQKDNDLYVYGNRDRQIINFKTTYKSTSFINSLKDNFAYQKNKIINTSHPHLCGYLLVLIIVNIIIFITL